MEYLPGKKLLSHVRDGLISALGAEGFTYLRAEATGIAPPPGCRRTLSHDQARNEHRSRSARYRGVCTQDASHLMHKQ